MDPHDKFFDAATAAQEQASEMAAEETAAAFEEAIVKQLLAGAGGNLAQARRAAHEQTGQGLLTFAWFQATYPAFPLRLGAARIGWVHDTTIWQLLDGFAKTPLFKAFQKFLVSEQLDDRETSVAFIFRAKRRLLVLHNWQRDGEISAQHNQGTRIVHHLGNVAYTLERFPRLLEVVGGQWFTDG